MSDGNNILELPEESASRFTKLDFTLSIVGLVAWGLALIGVSTNLIVGSVVLVAAFILLAREFWKWAKINRWRVGVRWACIAVGGIISAGLIGKQVASQYRQDQEHLSSEREAISQPAPTPKPIFSARLNVLMTLKFPGPLLCIYNSQLGKTIAPVNIAINVEATNLKPTRTRIYTYQAKALVEYKSGGQVVRETYPLFSVPIQMCEVYEKGS
ncbi:MAG TPA: hypothetical protein VF708_15875 [Pyrinomonadaceae bacterium]|jgi:hypothetical protein